MIYIYIYNIIYIYREREKNQATYVYMHVSYLRSALDEIKLGETMAFIVFEKQT